MKGLIPIHGMMLVCVLLIGSVIDAPRSLAEERAEGGLAPARGRAVGCGEEAELRKRQWRVLLHSLASVPDMQKVAEVNRFFNRLPYAEDSLAWESKDYWCTPQEFLAKGSGDCEDYALAKYCTLVAAGVDDNDLYLSCVLLMPKKTRHMVLCYAPEPEGDALILDNTTTKLLPLSARRDIIPIYNFNRDGAFVPRQGNQRGIALGKKISLFKWQDFLSRVENAAPALVDPEDWARGLAASPVLGPGVR